MRKYYKSFIQQTKNNKSKSTLNTTIIIRKDSFKDKIAKMQSVKNAVIEFSEIHCTGVFTPLQANLKNIQYTLRFKKDSIITPIVSFFEKHVLKNAKVEGIDEDGHEVIYRIFNDYDIYGTYDYDDIVSYLEIDLKNYKRSITDNEIIKRLQNTLQNFEQLL